DLDLAGVQSRSNRHTDACESLSDRECCPDGLRGPVKSRQHAVTCLLYSPTPVAFDLTKHDVVVTVEQIAPALIADRRNGLRRLDNVGEQQGRKLGGPFTGRGRPGNEGS